MKKFYYFISMILLGLILTSHANAGDEHPRKKNSETDWSEYERKTIGDYIYFDDFVTDENGERLFFRDKKMLIYKNDFRVGKSCLMQQHLQYGQKYREDYFYTDEEGWFCNRNGLLIDAYFTPDIIMLNDNCWIKVIDYNNSTWTSIDTNYVNEVVGSGITFTGNYKIHGTYGNDTSLYVNSKNYECKTIIIYIDINGDFKKDSETFNMKNYRTTTYFHAGKNAGILAWNFITPRSGCPWFESDYLSYRGIATSVHWQTVDVDDNEELQHGISISPNPFSESTIINYELQTAGRVKIDIFNSLGEKITTLVDEWQVAGRNSCELGVRSLELAAGMYYYRIQFGDRIESGKLVLIK